ncbi:DUF1513 domain-containing protein [Chitinilyticum litopenaei]|uniref:DUF1513 domain-containing protein n=1 Tax=Chitinilyticum litopenaei TaxID=1121276 RepID=UPI0005BB1AA6|nr:DUF1513 domain-containing protein [Chitinilyticum litopenaei]
MTGGQLTRRRLLQGLLVLGALPLTGIGRAAPVPEAGVALIGASWRGPNAGDAYYAGVLEADWRARTLRIRYAVPLPGRAHALLAEPEPELGLLVLAARPGKWLLRCNDRGEIVQHFDVAAESAHRLNGHAVYSEDGRRLFCTETDSRDGKGRIGVRDARSLAMLTTWDTGGIDPHQLLPDAAGNLLVANGGAPRTASDAKHDLQRMAPSLVRLETGAGRRLGQWTLPDPRLSLRHLAWGLPDAAGLRYLGIAIQAEHDSRAERARAPVLAVFDGERLWTPAGGNDGVGYSGDIVTACDGGFALSSNQAGKVLLWRPGLPDKLEQIVDFKESYALAHWPGPQASGGVMVATAFGLVRWHPQAQPAFLAWPEPMALDNHWISLA